MDNRKKRRLFMGEGEESARKMSEPRRAKILERLEKIAKNSPNQLLDQSVAHGHRGLIEIDKVFNVHYCDGAIALWETLFDVFGTVDLRERHTMFGTIYPRLITVEIAPGVEKQVPISELAIPEFNDAHFQAGKDWESSGSIKFRLNVVAQKEYLNAIKGLFVLVGEYLKKNSIYRGKAIGYALIQKWYREQAEINFLDIATLDTNQVIFPDFTQEQIEVNLWAPLSESEFCRKQNIPLKRSVLLHGGYGTGKSLTALVTAKIATENGWTFIKCRAGSNVLKALEFAKMYEPAIIFVEDIDTEISKEEDREDCEGKSSKSHIKNFLDDFDGIEAKHHEIMAVLTTNKVEEIHPGMLRPGRIDAVIEIDEPDKKAIERVLRLYGKQDFEEDFDWKKAIKASKGLVPAAIREVIERAKLYSLRSGEGEKIQISHFIDAVKQVRKQMELIKKNNSSNKSKDNLFDKFVKKLVKEIRYYD